MICLDSAPSDRKRFVFKNIIYMLPKTFIVMYVYTIMKSSVVILNYYFIDIANNHNRSTESKFQVAWYSVNDTDNHSQSPPGPQPASGST